MKHKLSTWKVALALIALACLVVLPQAVRAQAEPIESVSPTSATADYVVVDTGQTKCYDNSQEITCPQPGEPFYGQDAQYQDAQYAGNQPSYVDNGDGTITDLNTGLMWQQTPGDKLTWNEAVTGADTFSLAGYDDWRLPTIKELY